MAIRKAIKQGWRAIWIPFVCGLAALVVLLAIGFIGITFFPKFLEEYNQYFGGIAAGVSAVVVAVLVGVTVMYARATKQQAEASVKMAEETREQRVMASRPVIIQKAIVETETKLASHGSKDWFSHFEVYNVGNGPAIEVEISLIKQDKTPIHSERRTYLRAGEPPILFPSNAPFERVKLEESTYYLASEYQSISSHRQQPMWYQTRLPFEVRKASEEGRIYVIAGELEFREVTEKDRIDAFSRRSEPK